MFRTYIYLLFFGVNVNIIGCIDYSNEYKKNEIARSTNPQLNSTIQQEIKDSVSIIYYNDGTVQAKGKMENHRKQGTWKYWDEKGNISIIANYVNDSLHGVFKYFHKNGKIAGEGNFIMGKHDGDWICWYENGQQSFLIHINSTNQQFINMWDEEGNQLVKNGNGIFNYNLPYGSGKLIGEVRDMYPYGSWKYYDKDGNVTLDSEDPSNIDLLGIP